MGPQGGKTGSHPEATAADRRPSPTMTTSRAPYADRLPPVVRAPAPVSLATLHIDLAAVARFPATLLGRRAFLPIGWTDGALEVVVPPRFSTTVADEVAFAAGCPLRLVEAGDGNLPKLIQSALEALARGERALGPKTAESAPATSDLVYLEDLSALGAAAPSPVGGAAPSLGGLSAGPALVGDGISLGAALSAALRQEPAPASSPRTADLLPPVVDLEPAARPAPPPTPRTPPPPPPAAARRGGREEELFEDPDASDLDLLGLPELEDEPEGPRALLAGSASPETARLGLALRGFGLQVTDAPLDATLQERIRTGDPALMLLAADDPEGDPLGTLRSLRRDKTNAAAPLVVLLLVPPELQGWRAEADLQATYGADLVLGPGVEPPVLRRRLAAAFRTRTGRELSLRPPPGEAKALELSRQAAERYLAGRLEEAVSLFEEALRTDPSLASAQVGLAMARIKQQLPVEAILAFERALQVEPQLYSALRNLALLYEKRGFRQKALDTWERALSAHPNDDQRTEILDRLLVLQSREP